MYKVAVFASTRGTNLQSLLDARLRAVQIACLVTDKAACGAAEKARKAGIPVHFIDPAGKDRAAFDREAMATLRPYGIDLVVLGGYMRIVGPEMVRAYAGRIINIHPSLLPKHTGMDLDVHRAVLLAGDTETGMTVHLVDEGVDTGAIILQKSVPVLPGDTPETLKNKVQALEKEWYPRVVQDFADGKIIPKNA